MTVEELKKMCMDQLSEGRNWVVLHLPDRYPTGERMRMVASDQRSPLGEIFNSEDGRGTVARFKASDVLAYIESLEAAE